MCGRVACALAPSELTKATGAPFGCAECEYHPTHNAPPTTRLPVLVQGADGAHCIKVMHWGLIPSFAETPAMTLSTFNARIESLGEKPMFRRLLPQKRCVAVIEGYYEWQTANSLKEPYFITSKQEEVMLLAGLFDCWSNGEETRESFTVITRESTKGMCWLHSRMPVMLDSAKVQSWLSGSE